MPNARPQCRGQAPQPRSGAPLGAGLDSGTADAEQSGLPSIALPCSAPPPMILHRGRRTHGTSASVSNLQQLTGVTAVFEIGYPHDVLVVSRTICCRAQKTQTSAV